MTENKRPGLRNYNAVAISAFPPLLNVRTIGRSKRMAHAFIERSVRYTTKTVRRRGLCRTRHSD